jgi:DNA-binding transcriptional ArsR family regulator
MSLTATLTIRAQSPKPRLAPEPAPESLQLYIIMRALGDPMRVQIIRAIAAANSGANCRACTCPSIPKSTLAHHFKVLRQAGLIHSQTIGNAIQNTLRKADLEARFPGLLQLILQGD